MAFLSYKCMKCLLTSSQNYYVLLQCNFSVSHDSGFQVVHKCTRHNNTSNGVKLGLQCACWIVHQSSQRRHNTLYRIMVTVTMIKHKASGLTFMPIHRYMWCFYLFIYCESMARFAAVTKGDNMVIWGRWHWVWLQCLGTSASFNSLF
jgi:hypothetical protein